MHAARSFLQRMFPCLVQVQPGRYLLAVHAKPGARASAFATPLTPTLSEADLRIAAPPIGGQANAELLCYLAELIERGLRAMTADHAEYVKDTSYAQVVTADAAASAAAAQITTGASGGDRKSGKKGKLKSATAASSASLTMSLGDAGDSQRSMKKSNALPSQSVLPDRVEVSLACGGTSREKTVLVMFPGTRAQLTAVLEKESRE
ncbi:hypothetical protein JKF63_01723 [Porcisia hertigi]|uniref:Uncharacterized protein n=1 Tax=Porcisia hertigi TaxID=2761500 RepID=A0A836HIM1_9TRYP|nr:hypothetical protein JKF63_01723 [Porcisia hertigi]